MPVLLYLFRRIEKSLHGQPALLILDEAWIMLGHPVFQEKIREWFKVFRKSNCALVLATQNISDAVNSPIWDVILSETATKIFLANPKAREAANVYAKMGLNPHQIEMLAGATPNANITSPQKRAAGCSHLPWDRWPSPLPVLPTRKASPKYRNTKRFMETNGSEPGSSPRESLSMRIKEKRHERTGKSLSERQKET